MKNHRLLLTALVAFFASTATALAQDVSGHWKWTSLTKSGDKVEIVADLDLKDGTLTGTVTSPQGPAAISDASFKDGVVAFTVTRSSGPNVTTFKYHGTLSGSTIKGSIEKTGPAKDARATTDWNATRGAK